MIAVVQAPHPERSLQCLCALLGLNRARYYARRREDLAALAEATRLVLAFPGYGYRRVTRALQRDGWSVNQQRVLRVMRQE